MSKLKKVAQSYDYKMRCVNNNAAYFTTQEAFEAGAKWQKEEAILLIKSAYELGFCNGDINSLIMAIESDHE